MIIPVTVRVAAGALGALLAFDRRDAARQPKSDLELGQPSQQELP